MRYFTQSNIVLLGSPLKPDEGKHICSAVSKRLAGKIASALNKVEPSREKGREYFMRGTGNPKRVA